MFGRRRKLDEFASEIESHLDLEAERFQDEGLSEPDARFAARRSFGNLTRAKERFYETGRWLAWDHFWQDVRYCLRMLRKSPGFAAISILTIALGVGATTAIFSVVEATLWHPLPYPHPEQLVSIQDDLPGASARDVGLSEPEWRDLQASGIFEWVSPSWFDENNMTGASTPDRVSLLIVAPDYFALLGVKPQLGVTFDPRNHSPGFTGEAVIGDGLWKRAFGRDPKILGRGIRLDTDLYTIIGVMPPGFRSPERSPAERNAEVWAATSFYGPPMLDNPLRSVRNIPEAIARLKPGLTLDAAQSRVSALVSTLQSRYPADYPVRNAWRIRLVPLKETLVGDTRRSLILLLAAVGLVLLIGCLNVANLLLARASARAREMAVRQALGAGRRRLISQLLTESLLLSLLGGIAGIAFLLGAQPFLLRLVPDSVPRLSAVSINWTVLMFAAGASLLSGLVFGLAPALQSGRLGLVEALKSAARGAIGSREQARMRRALVVAELALSLVLTIAASLLLRSFWDLAHAPLGFNPQSVLTVRTRLPYPNDVKTDRYADPAQQGAFIRELLRRSIALPGVDEAAIGDSGAIPLDSSQHQLNRLAGRFFFTVEDRVLDSRESPVVDRLMVTPNYFHLLGIPLLRGRLLNESDDDRSPQVAVVNEAFARVYWPGKNAIGKRFRRDRAGAPWITVVGVVANSRTGSLAETDSAQVYVSLSQTWSHHLAIFLRGRFDPYAISKRLIAQVQTVDSTLPVFCGQMLDDTVSASLSERRFSLAMVGLFALTALFLAAIGIYGVISYMVAERTREIGIRLALGATGSHIVREVLGQGLRLAAAGAAIGLVGAVVVSHGMAGLLFGVKPTDPLTFAGVASLLILVALLACYVPARHATKVDPMIALREV
ncbi:MAG TPA: ABC transporter permease [Thermoanaerobaculia bacterium]